MTRAFVATSQLCKVFATDAHAYLSVHANTSVMFQLLVQVRLRRYWDCPEVIYERLLVLLQSQDNKHRTHRYVLYKDHLFLQFSPISEFECLTSSYICCSLLFFQYFCFFDLSAPVTLQLRHVLGGLNNINQKCFPIKTGVNKNCPKVRLIIPKLWDKIKKGR
jgi:hypothetical protein